MSPFEPLPATAKPATWPIETYRNHWQADGLIGAWILGQGADRGEIIEAHNGRLNATPNASPGIRYMGDRFQGLGRDFNGSTQRYRIDPDDRYHNDWDINSGLTLCAWVITDDFPGNGGRIISRSVDNNSDDAALQAIGNDFRFRVKAANGSREDLNTTSVNTGQLYHVCGVWDGVDQTNNVRIYLDGVLNADSTHGHTGTQTGAGAEFYIGATRGVDSSRHLNGGISELRYYNRPLSPSEIFHLYKDPWALYIERRSYFVALPAAAPIEKVASDTLLPKIDDTAAVTVTIAATETLLPKLADVASSFVTSAPSDTLLPRLDDTAALLAALEVTETLLPALDDVATSFLATVLTESLLIQLDDVAGATVTLAVSESLLTKIDEDPAAVAVMLSVSDDLAVVVADSATIFGAVTASDALTVSLTDVIAELRGLINVGDDLTVTVLDAADLTVALSASDALLVTLDDLASIAEISVPAELRGTVVVRGAVAAQILAKLATDGKVAAKPAIAGTPDSQPAVSGEPDSRPATDGTISTEASNE